MRLHTHSILVNLAVLCAAGIPLLNGNTARAQGRRSDYERAAGLRALTQNKVFRASVQPHWLDGNNRFWYRNDLADGRREFILVDAMTGRRGPAFDHARLAEAMAKATGRKVPPDRLPVEYIEFPENRSAVLLFSTSATWECDLRTYALKERPDIKPALLSLPNGEPHPSRSAGPETTITFVNQTGNEIRLFWIDTEGNRQSYGSVRPGERREQHTFAGHVWLVTDPDGRILGVFEATENPGTAIVDGAPPVRARRRGERAPVLPGRGLSPDGRWIAGVKDNNIWLRARETNRETALTRDGAADDAYGPEVFWSPDSQHLVALKTKAGENHKVYLIESSPKDQVQPKMRPLDYLKPGDRIPVARPRLFDVAAQKEIPINDSLFPTPWDISEVRWEPDSQRFTFAYNQRGHQALRILAVDAATGRAEAIVNEQSRTFLDYAGKRYVFYLDDTHEILWMSERDGWNHLYLYDARTGKVKNQITRGEWVVRGVDRVDAQKRQIWFRASGIYPQQDPYYVHYCRINLDGSGLVHLTEGDGTHSLAYSPDGRFYLDTCSRVDMPPVTELRRSEDGRLICPLERADAKALLATGWKMPERFSAKGRDGRTAIYGVIIRPTNFDPRKRYPVIENIYAGPQDSYVPKAWSSYYGMQELAELGFIVVQIDGMGTSNRSKAFHDVCWRNLGDAGFPDRILWIRAAAAKYPSMDISRVGIYGTSAGGQNALGGLLFHPDFYKAGVADCGCHDNRMDKIWWNELWMGWPVGPWYAEQSNVTNAPKLKGKLLLMVGEMDNNVDPASTMQVVNALVKADKDFDLLVMPGAGHGVAGTPYGKRRLQDFFVRNLLGVEPRSRP
jgi:dipeptidyl-peptidase-4